MDVKAMDDQAREHTLAIARSAYEAVAPLIYKNGNVPAFDDLPAEVKDAWFVSSAMTTIHQGFPTIAANVPSEKLPGTLSVAWEVNGGLTDTMLEPKLQRQTFITGDEYHGPDGPAIFAWRMMSALSYARTLMNPDVVNFVSLKWIRF
ncbi:MAG TPA: hypothetical protein V6D29_12300 [Leptolyngbyaceae cyanobacterium]